MAFKGYKNGIRRGIDHVAENAYNLYCARSYLAYMRSWLSDKSRYLNP